ncbi:right-handed parallel beta-helix repeat-containing protein [Symmachiella dynata]|uniref:right-handed parallel beta-helix repeat-containing protein n=1 Tax=Symmachiella dynata TaxID=2527995 RepID=UPI0018D3A369|nr:right-handed parallel beta-helix repeat-containing protein [Symmachiella dynata]
MPCVTRAAEPLAVIGTNEPVGCLESPERTKRLIIDKTGTFENQLIDGEWYDGNLVKIRADNVVLRHCEIRNSRSNGIFVSGRNVTIESCKIHHCLAGSFLRQQDAHGITGSPRNLTIRNCEIYYVSGDAVQFDPDRNKWDDVTIENCTFWTGPLKVAAADFYIGERPGENAIDTKCADNQPRAHLDVKNSLFYGWGSGQIENQAALNLKEHINATVENCVFRDNDICFRLRGSKKNTLVSVSDCAVYNSKIAFRLEDQIRDLVINGLAIGDGVGELFKKVDMRGRSYRNINQGYAPPYERALRFGLKQAAAPQEPTESSSVPEPTTNETSQRPLRSYLPGGSWRTVLAVAIVLFMPFLGIAFYVIASGRRKVFRQVVGEAFQRMFSRQ